MIKWGEAESKFWRDPVQEIDGRCYCSQEKIVLSLVDMED